MQDHGGVFESANEVRGRLDAVPERVWLALILAAAAGQRLYAIASPDVWIDEANLILTSAEPVGVLLGKLRLDSSPPLYYLLLHYWQLAFGDSPLALRLLAFVCGITLVWVTWWVGRDWISSRVGLWAAFYVAMSPVASFYSQQVRMYGLLALFALVSMVALARFLRDGTPRSFWTWVGATLLALYDHNFAFHLVFAQGLLIAFSGQVRARLGSWALAAAIGAALYAPWVPSFLAQLGNRDHYAWFLPYWEFWGPTGAIEKTFRSFSPAGEFQAYSDISTWGDYYALPTIGASAIGLYGLWLAARRARVAGAASLWPAVLLLSPIATGLTASYLLTPHYVSGRVDQMMFPAFALLVGLGIASLRPVWAKAALGAAILTLGVAAKTSMYEPYENDVLDGGDRALAEAVAEAWQPDDVIVCTSLSRASLTYYLRRAGIDAKLLSYPRVSGRHLGAQNDQRLLRDRAALLREAELVLETARRGAGRDGRVFVVWVHGLVNYPLRREALPPLGFREVETIGTFRQFGTGLQVEVRLYAYDGAA